MFGKQSGYQYQSLPQRDSTPGLFTSTESFVQTQFRHQGHSFDYVPRVTDNDFTDRSQGWLSWICNLIVTFLVFTCTLITFPVSGWFVLKMVPNYQRIVVFRLGRVRPPKGPGVVLILPLIDQWQRVDLRTRAFNIPPCKVTTKDGGLVSVGADIQFRIWSPVMSVVAVQDLNTSTRLTAQNAMTYSLGKKTVKEIQTEKVKLGEHLGTDINEMTRPWGLEVDRVELTVESVLKGPDESLTGPVILPPSVPGLEGITGPIQQLAMHFLANSGPSQPPAGHTHVSSGDTVSFVDEQGPRAPTAERKMNVEELLRAVELFLSEQLVSQVGACFQFHISLHDGQIKSYYVDLSKGRGAVGVGTLAGVPDVALQMSEEDLLALFEGKLRPYAAYTSGRLKVQGDLRTAMKLEELIKLMRQQ
ncbi:stomatin-like protein 1 [Megalops cyprinoides]|uniref:stomatin-like protein 1 n=1 Tax=Megalops cyprinoides TaxID=118141 RepID=UPI001864E251|nr:stomatin-like protein 1 [Megalops cyprinoides]